MPAGQIGKGPRIIGYGMSYVPVFDISDVNYSQGVFCISLFHEAIELTVVLKSSFHSFEGRLIGHIRNRHRDLERHCRRIAEHSRVECPGYRTLVLILKAEEHAVIAEYIQEQDRRKQYREESFQSATDV